MRQILVPPTRLNADSVSQGFDVAFGPDMLRRVHGPSTVVSPFVEDHRVVQFDIDTGAVPMLIRPFFGGGMMRVVTNQHLKKSVEEWIVCNKVNFVGSGLFRVRPVFRVYANQQGVYLGGTVRHEASLPPPLNRIAEAFMAKMSEREVRHFVSIVSDAPPERTRPQTP